MQHNITLTVSAGQPATMSSREIAELTGKRHDHVLADVRKMLSELGMSIPEFSGVYESENGQQYECFHLPKDLTITLVAGYNLKVRHAIVKRWQELEAAAPKPAELSRMDILKLAMESEQARIEAEAKLAIAAPKVAHYDAVVERSTLVTATQVGQKIGLSAVALNKVLDELGLYNGGVKRGRVFKQWVIDKGYGELKQTEQGYTQALFTMAGEAWVIEKLISEGVI